MSQFLRDVTFKNLSLNEESIKEVNKQFLNIRDEGNRGIQEESVGFLKASYIIRFDQKGFLLYDFGKVLEYFRSAKSVERLVFMLQSKEHEQSFKVKGKGIDLRFDSLNTNNCLMVVQDDGQAWTDSTFLTLLEVINKFKNNNHLARNSWIIFAVQMLGVIVGLLLSLWAALNFSEHLKFSNPAAFTFLIAFVLFSNIWTYLYTFCLKVIDFFWPNISFKEKAGIYNFLKKLVVGTFCTFWMWVLAWLLKSMFGFIFSLLITKQDIK